MGFFQYLVNIEREVVFRNETDSALYHFLLTNHQSVYGYAVNTPEVAAKFLSDLNSVGLKFVEIDGTRIESGTAKRIIILLKIEKHPTSLNTLCT